MKIYQMSKASRENFTKMVLFYIRHFASFETEFKELTKDNADIAEVAESIIATVDAQVVSTNYDSYSSELEMKLFRNELVSYFRNVQKAAGVFDSAVKHFDEELQLR